MSQARSLETPHAALCPLLPAIFFRIKPHFQHFSIHVTSCAWPWRLREGGVDRASPAGSPDPNRNEIPRPIFTLTTAAAGGAAPRETTRLIVAVGLIMVKGGGCVRKERVRCGDATSFLFFRACRGIITSPPSPNAGLWGGRSDTSAEAITIFFANQTVTKQKKQDQPWRAFSERGGRGRFHGSPITSPCAHRPACKTLRPRRQKAKKK